MHPYKSYKDIAYYTGPEYHPENHLLDLYIPQDTHDFDVLVFVHGGAWKIGDKSMHAHIGKTLARAGIGIAVINHRLSPQVMHPEHLLDVARATHWVITAISEYGGNSERVHLMGHSSGAHLVALLALHTAYMRRTGTTHPIGCTICISGIYDIPSFMKTSFGRSIILPAFGTDPHVWNDASPIQHVCCTSSPFLLMITEKDPMILKEQTIQFRNALKNCEFYEIPGKNHFNSIFDFGKKGDTATEYVLSFIKTQ